MYPIIVSISGFSSNVGKTTLVCELLKRFPGWEAVKISLGHYRSCGKDPQACCISPLLREHPTVFSECAATCVSNKDTGRYWQAGASNVHWLICTNEQLDEGTRLALGRVQSAGVFIEGTGFLKYVPADYSIMVVDPALEEIKGSAVRMAARMDAFYIPRAEPDERLGALIRERLSRRNVRIGDVPVFYESSLNHLVKKISQATIQRANPSRSPAIL